MGFILPADALSYSADGTADTAPDSFTSGVNDILGAVNNFGTTIGNLRDRFTRAGASSGQYAVPVSGKPAGTVAAARPENLGDFWTVPRMILAAGVLALLVGVTFKLAKG